MRNILPIDSFLCILSENTVYSYPNLYGVNFSTTKPWAVSIHVYSISCKLQKQVYCQVVSLKS